MEHAPPGFRFKPTREELIRYYLNPWVAEPGKKPVGELQGIVCVADIYTADPDTLTSQHGRCGHDDGNWYFLCVARWKGVPGSRARRAVKGGGTWHGYGKRVAVAKVGHRQTFEYRDAGGRKTPWLMEEFGTVLPAATDGAGVKVLCRVHRTPRPTADDEERGESSKAARSSKRRRRDMAADAKDEMKPLDEPEPLQYFIAKDEPEPWEILTMKDEPEPLEQFFVKDEPEQWEMLTMENEPEPLEQFFEPEAWEMITMEDEPEPLEMLTKNLPSPLEILTKNLTLPLQMLTNNLPLPLEMLTKNLTSPLEMLTQNLPSPLEMLTKNLPLPLQTLTKNMPDPLQILTKSMPDPLQILAKNLPEPLEILTKEKEPEPLDAEAPTTTTTAFNQDSSAVNKEATYNVEMEMPADAEWHYPELFEQREPPPMEDIMKPLPAPTAQEFKQGAPPTPPTAQESKQGAPPAMDQEFSDAAWGWGGHGQRCLGRPIPSDWSLVSFFPGH